MVNQVKTEDVQIYISEAVCLATAYYEGLRSYESIRRPVFQEVSLPPETDKSPGDSRRDSANQLRRYLDDAISHFYAAVPLRFRTPRTERIAENIREIISNCQRV